MKTIPGYEPLTGSTIRGSAALAIGGFLILLTGLLWWVAWGDLPEWVDKPNVSPMAFTLITFGSFGMIGLYLLALGIIDSVKKISKENKKKLRPGEPWYWDYSWDSAESADISFRQTLKRFLGLTLAAGIVLPLNYVAFTKASSTMPKVVVGVFDALLLLSFATLCYRLLAYLIHGRSKVRYNRFPLALGEEVQLTLLAGSAIENLEQLSCTIRCIEEQYQQRQTPAAHTAGSAGTSTTVELVGIERFSKTTELGALELAAGAAPTLVFELPQDPELRSRLTDQPALYWDLIVKGKRSGVDYHKRFLLPVY